MLRLQWLRKRSLTAEIKALAGSTVRRGPEAPGNRSLHFCFCKGPLWPAKDLIRYDLLVQDALKGVVRKVLIDVQGRACRASTISTSPSRRIFPAFAFRTACAKSILRK